MTGLSGSSSVTEIEGTIVGFAEVYLQSFLVSAPYRKQGLGETLIKAASQWAREKGATELQLHTWKFAEGPVPFYEKRGYRTLKRYMVIDLL